METNSNKYSLTKIKKYFKPLYSFFFFRLVFYSQNQKITSVQQREIKRPIRRQSNITTLGPYMAQHLNHPTKKLVPSTLSSSPRVLRRKLGTTRVKNNRHLPPPNHHREIQVGALYSPETYLIGAREHINHQIKGY